METLQMLRAVAALLVVFAHVLDLEHRQWAGLTQDYAPSVPFGQLGVYAFFAVSGFIMYFTAGRQFEEPGAPARFLSKRLSRIVPMYWLFTALTLLCPFAYNWRPASLGGVALSLAFLPDVTRGPWYEPVLAVGWTLSFEMLFYLVFAACLGLPRRLGLTVLFCVFPGILVVEAALGATRVANESWWPLAIWLARQHLLLFVFGVLLAMAQERFGRIVDRRGFGVWLGLAALVAAPTVMLAFHVPGHEKPELLLAAVVVALCAMTCGRSWDGLAPFIRLGDASYALYLSHSLVIGALSHLWLATVGPKALLAFGVVAVAASCMVAMAVHVWIERPLTRASQRLRLAAFA